MVDYKTFADSLVGNKEIGSNYTEAEFLTNLGFVDLTDSIIKSLKELKQTKAIAYVLEQIEKKECRFYEHCELEGFPVFIKSIYQCNFKYITEVLVKKLKLNVKLPGNEGDIIWNHDYCASGVTITSEKITDITSVLNHFPDIFKVPYVMNGKWEEKYVIDAYRYTK